MAVYVDNARIPYRNMLMSHLMADTREELLEIVKKIGVNQKWIQYSGTPREHFDVCAQKREAAIREGALPVSGRELARLIAKKRG